MSGEIWIVVVLGRVKFIVIFHFRIKLAGNFPETDRQHSTQVLYCKVLLSLFQHQKPILVEKRSTSKLNLALFQESLEQSLWTRPDQEANPFRPILF